MSKSHDITVIAGLSGVGKTYVIEALMRDSNDYAHFSAGTLIKKRMANIERDSLRELDKNSILSNQYLLVEQFKEELLALDTNLKVLFDAHMLIDNDQTVIEIPFEIFEQAAPARMIFLSDDAEKIIARRDRDKTRKRPVRTVAEISMQQDRSIELAKEHSRLLCIPFISVIAGDVQAVSEAIRTS